jgi:hypothetical protein
MKEETRSRQKQAAQNLIDMERGVFPYPEGMSGTYKDGRPKINRTIAFTTPGTHSETMYSRAYLSKHLPDVMEAPYFKQQYALFKHERDTSVIQVLESAQLQTKALDRISLGLLEKVADTLEKNPEQIKPSEALKYAHVYFRLAAEVQGKLDSGKQDKLAVVLMNMDERIQDPAERQRIREGIERFRMQRAKQLEEYQSAGEALDADVYDGECEEVD